MENVKEIINSIQVMEDSVNLREYFFLSFVYAVKFFGYKYFGGMWWLLFVPSEIMLGCIGGSFLFKKVTL